MMFRSWIAVGTLGAFLLVAVPGRVAFAQAGGAPSGMAPEQDGMAQAKSHFEAGKSAFQARDFGAAIREFKAAQALRPSPVLDYNIGLAFEQLSRPRPAAKYFRRYIEGKPDAANRAEVEQKIAALEQQAAASPPSAAEEADAQASTAQAPPYQYGSPDPYGTYQQAPAPSEQPQPLPQAPAKKKSYWWIVFPIVGGGLLLSLLFIFYLAALSTSSNPYAVTGNNAPTQFNAAPPVQNEPGLLFRF